MKISLLMGRKKCDRQQLNSKPKRKLVAILLAMLEVIEGD